MINIGIIGMGRIGRVHMESICTSVPEAKVVAIADPYLTSETETLALEKYKVLNAYKDYKKILSDDSIDAVVICSSTDTHSAISIEALKAGKHVMCEKPIDTDYKRIIKVVEAVKENSHLKFQVGFNRRFDHNFMALKEQSKNLGAIHIIKITSRDPAPPPIEYIKVSGGLFNDMMIHDLDMVRFLSSSEVEEVHVYGGALVDKRIGEAGDIDTAIVSMKLSSGAFAVIDNSRQAVYGYDQRAEVFCANGMVCSENDAPSTVKVVTSSGVNSEKPLHFFLDRYMQAYAKELKCFVEAIINDTPTICNETDGLKPFLIAKACAKSLLESRPVTIAEIEEELSR